MHFSVAFLLGLLINCSMAAIKEETLLRHVQEGKVQLAINGLNDHNYVPGPLTDKIILVAAFQGFEAIITVILNDPRYFPGMHVLSEALKNARCNNHTNSVNVLNHYIRTSKTVNNEDITGAPESEGSMSQPESNLNQLPIKERHNPLDYFKTKSDFISLMVALICIALVSICFG